jgi:hypothetical protein
MVLRRPRPGRGKSSQSSKSISQKSQMNGLKRTCAGGVVLAFEIRRRTKIGVE